MVAINTFTATSFLRSSIYKKNSIAILPVKQFNTKYVFIG